MAFFGTILQEIVKLHKGYLNRFKPKKGVHQLQIETLRRLITTAKKTEFGKHYNYQNLLRSGDLFQAYKSQVPIFDYNKMYNEWWHRTVNDESNVTWPGKIKFFALTSGTSESASKRVPVSKQQIKAVRLAGIRQTHCLYDLKFSPEFYMKGVLMLGGSTKLNPVKNHFEGDLSGILTSNLPEWFYKKFYKPGKKIAEIKDWHQKLDAIVKEAKDWDIGTVAGVPAWMQMLFERIIKHYKVNHIHEIWPNLQIFVHGGVSFTPYQESFKKLLGKPITYLDTYLASEGYFAYALRPNSHEMKLVLDKGFFYEFVPFNEKNFVDGNIIDNPESIDISGVKEGAEYALLISTCSGAWRYLLGDTVKFTSVKESEIIITGRTKHFLSLCGEHLSVDNMNQAINWVSKYLKVNMNEFTVTGINYENLFAHKWYIGVDDISKVDKKQMKELLDKKLCELNDDYTTERSAALKEVIVEVLPVSIFYAWMEKNGKVGSQNKFPRVMKGNTLIDWENFLKEKGY